MADRDKGEENVLLYSQAFGTLDALDTLEESGMHVPKKLKDILTTNKAKFKKEMEEVIVEDITEQDLTVSTLPRLEPPQGLNQFGSNLDVVDRDAMFSLRSPALEDEQLAAASGSNTAS